MRTRGCRLVLCLIILCAVVFFTADKIFAQQTGEEETDKTLLAETMGDKIVPGPASLKEKTGIYVFLAWMWLSILVLVFFLRLKVKEVDRLYRLEFFLTSKK